MSDQWVLDSWDTDYYCDTMKNHISKLPEGRKPLGGGWYKEKLDAVLGKKSDKEKEQDDDSSSEQQR